MFFSLTFSLSLSVNGPLHCTGLSSQGFLRTGMVRVRHENNNKIGQEDSSALAAYKKYYAADANA